MARLKAKSRGSGGPSRRSGNSSGSSNNKQQPASYPVMQLDGFRMGLHTDQQSLILSEMSTARKKLSEDNQRLRDDLDDARMVIRLLQVKLRHAESEKNSTIKVKAVRSSDSTVKGGVPAGYHKALDKAVSKNMPSMRKNRFFSRNRSNQPTRKEAFKNPSKPGGKTFGTSKTTRINGSKRFVEEDTTPKMIMFPTPQEDPPQSPERDSEPPSSTTVKKSVQVDHLQREIVNMASSSSEPLSETTSQESSEFESSTSLPSSENERGFYDDELDELDEHVLRFADQLEVLDTTTPVIHEEKEDASGEASEEDSEEEARGTIVSTLANGVIQVYLDDGSEEEARGTIVSKTTNGVIQVYSDNEAEDEVGGIISQLANSVIKEYSVCNDSDSDSTDSCSELYID